LAKVLPALDFAEGDLLVANVLPALLTGLDGLQVSAIFFSFLSNLMNKECKGFIHENSIAKSC